MTVTYYWTTAEKDCLKRDNGDDTITWIPADPANADYAEFLASGAVAEPYPEGPPPPPPTTAEKVDQLLKDYNLTRDELRAAFSATQEVPES